MNQVRVFLGIFSGVPFALLYGAAARIVFGVHQFVDVFTTLSFAFLLLVPVAIGALTVALAPAEKRSSGLYAFFMPWVSILIGSIIAGVLAVEAIVCVAMALPVMFSMGSFGGLLGWFVCNKVTKGSPQVVGAILLAPFVFAPLEKQFPLVDSYHTVHTQIEINARAEVVWQNIARVPRIRDGERHFSVLFDVFGAPKPLEATLDSNALGAMRQGLFEDGLKFDEKIVVWDPGKRLDFEITPDTRAVHDMVWNEIGGPAFSVPTASYSLEPLANGHILLHLTSTHRLTTRFNDYGGWWSEWGMTEFQNQVLQIIKARCETQT